MERGALAAFLIIPFIERENNPYLQVTTSALSIYLEPVLPGELMKRITIYTIVLSLISFSMILAAPNEGFRAIRVINDLSHKSGKIGTYRALIIGISDY